MHEANLYILNHSIAEGRMDTSSFLHPFVKNLVKCIKDQTHDMNQAKRSKLLVDVQTCIRDEL